ncbi:MAG: RNA polymerase sigma factor [Mangrovibacterium sp.]
MTASRNDIDFHLVQSLRRGDHAAFEKLFQRYARKLFSFSVSYLKREDEAEEIVQEVFSRIWANRESLREDTSFQSYLFTIAFNAVKKIFNENARANLFKLEIVDALDEESSATDYEQHYQLVIRKLDQFIAEMPEKRRQIFVWRKKESKSVKQIAGEMNISVKTVENQITEAMKYLKERFDKELPEDLILLYFYLQKSMVD